MLAHRSCQFGKWAAAAESVAVMAEAARDDEAAPRGKDREASGSPSAVIERSPEGRFVFKYNGRKIYEWEQTLDEVLVYIDTPEGIRAKQLSCVIEPRRLAVGLKGNRPFLDERLCGTIIADESMWILDAGVLSITLAKAHKGETWHGLFEGHGELDPRTQEETKKQLMLQRFQEEHPGFDFSGAEFSGAVPNPREFMRDL